MIVALAVGQSVAFGEEVKVNFDIPRQPVDTALLKFAQQAQVPVLFPGGTFTGIESNRLEGEYRIEQGLEILLDGTGVEAAITDEPRQLVVRTVSSLENETNNSEGEQEMAVVQSTTTNRNRSRNFIISALAAVFSAVGSGGSPANAQEQQAQQVEEIVVTGSLLPRQTDMPQPIVTIDSEQILTYEQKGTIAEIFKTLPQSTGSISTINSSESSTNSNTTTINLRGLGFRSNLVLLNGKRQTINGSGIGVDVNSLAPLIMVDRVEILTDGASAVYGSDAVSGVVNFITRNNFEGTEVRLTAERIENQSPDTPNINFGIIMGAQGVNTSVVGALEINRTEEVLVDDLTDRKRLLLLPESSFGNPGSFTPAAGGARFPDPLCEDPRLAGSTGLRAGRVDRTRCAFNTGQGRNLIPENREVRGMAAMTRNLDFGITGQLEVNFARKETILAAGTGSPLFTPLPLVPANNPGVIAANEADPDFVVQDYLWSGRVLSLLSKPVAFRNGADSDTVRVALSFDGPILNSGWDWRAFGAWPRNEETNKNNDAVNSRILNALQGYGGPGCQFTPETDPDRELQGVGNCQWFNPFANNALASPGDQEFNDPELVDFIIADRTIDGTAELVTLNALLTGDLIELPGGTARLAIGYQHRQQQFTRDLDELTNQGRSEGSDGFRFFRDALPDFSGDRDTDAVFGELVVPVFGSLELQAAVRYEETDGIDSVDPKFGIIWSPVENVFLRGTYGTSFQLAREIESFGLSSGGSSGRVVGGEGILARGVRVGNPNLSPQESDNFTVGMTWNFLPNATLSVDWWDIEFKDLVVGESADAILLQDMQDGFIDDFPDKIIIDRE